VLPT
jgi:integrase/recombinase XerD